MSLVDTTDGVLMQRAYGWAFISPARKLYYNIVMTSISVAVAVIVGSIEALSLLAGKLHLAGWFWDGVNALSGHFGAIGYLIIAIFVLCWAASISLYRRQSFSSNPRPDNGVS
ncbi:MAG: HoxN/HupN/NixA family nickel/cobalt transporter, partial [Burkholderiaceae bacterium]|jgi:high-affinity nickel-transport protein|nr:HoxN/HupN/NixA family nickel/cobalt transporter [Burkholderiaceae bacterium]